MAYTRQYPNEISTGGSSVKECIINDDKDIKNIYRIISTEIGLSGSANGTRQCVLTGRFNSQGQIDFFEPTRQADVPYVGIKCDEIPAILVFANGYGESGARDMIKRIDDRDNHAWKLMDDTTAYLYIDCSISTGAITYGYSLYPEIYAYTPPSSPSKDQHWFDKSEAVMKRWDGKAWQKVFRIFVGKAVTKGKSWPTVEPYYAASRNDANSLIQMSGDTVSFQDGGKLKEIIARRFRGTADMALTIPVGRTEGANIWIEQVSQ